jgi:hypothetical protein
MTDTLLRNEGERALLAFARTLDEAGMDALLESFQRIVDGEDFHESMADFARVIGRHDLADLFLRRPS